MGRKDVEPVVIDLLEDTDEVTLQDFAAKKPQKYRKLQDTDLEKATVLRVQTSDDLLIGEPDANKLRAWLSIIALGKKVQPHDMSEIGCKSALQDPYNFSFSEAFCKKHPNIKRSYERFAASPRSAWRETPSRSAGDMSKCRIVNYLDHFRAWLISARQVSGSTASTSTAVASRGMGATLSPRPSRSAGKSNPLRRVTQS